MSETAGTFTCEDCGETFGKEWSDEEAAAEAQGLFPGIDVTDPDEAGVVCDDCFNRIMARARAEAPELIGEGWRDGQVTGYGAMMPDWPDVPVCTPMRNRLPVATGSCYRMASGSMVHVKPECRCPR